MKKHISPLEQSILACQSQDASLLRQAVSAIWRLSTAAHDPNADAIERAKLACQVRDVEAAKHAANAIAHPLKDRGDVNGAAPA